MKIDLINKVGENGSLRFGWFHASGCHGCVKLGKCAFDDDPVNAFTAKAKTADGFIFGSPVHYAAATGNLTAFMDRVFYSDGCGKGRAFYLKPAAAVASARRAGTTATLD